MGLDEVRQQREIVKKLKTFTKELEKPLNNNILTHLCSGLENFLGFNSETKGYDGQGIVYSDLDRLCDGVMGFLSGVLSNIKDHLGQHKTEISEAIRLLNDNKHLGKKGFNVAIEKVVAGVGRYNGYVKNSNKRVSDPIKALLTYFTEKTTGKFFVRFNDIQVDKVSDDLTQTDPEVTKAVDLVKQCLEKADDFNGKLDSTAPKNKKTQNAINDLNHELRVRVHSVREAVKYETDRLTALSRKEKENYDAIVKMVRKLESVQSCFKSEITQRVDGLVKKLKEDVQQIKEKLEAIYQELERRVSALDTWAWEADGFVSDALKKLDVILDEVDNTNKNGNKKSINYSAALIAGQAITLFEAGEAAKKAAQENVRLALTQVKEMNDALKMDLYKVKTQIKNEIWNHVRDHIKTPYEKLEGKVKEDLTTLKGKITQPLGEIVNSASTFNKQFKATQAAIEMAIGQVDADIKKIINLEHVGDIEGRSGKVSALLLKAIGGGNAFEPLKTYMSKLHSEIMEPVKKAVDKIAAGIGRCGINNTDLLKSVMSTARKDLEALNNLVSDSVPSTDLGNLNGILGVGIGKLSLKRYDSVVKNVVASLLSNSISKTHLQSMLTYLSAIAQDVSKHSNDVVQQVIDKINEKLQEEVKNVATEINITVRDCNALVASYGQIRVAKIKIDEENVKSLAKLVSFFGNDINTRVTKLHNDIGETIFKTADRAADGEHNYELGEHLMNNFKSAYDTLNNGKLKNDTFQNDVADKLTAEIGNDGMATGGGADNKISALAPRKFSNYDEKVNQDSLSSGEPNNLEGTLPAAIKQIKTKVDDALQSIESLKSDIVSHADDVKSKLAAMCEIMEKAAEGNSESVIGKLSELRSKIGRNTLKKLGDGVLMKIKNDLHDLKSKNLNDAIMAATDFSNHAERLKTSTITSLKDIVDTQLNDCMAELTKQANTHYVTTMHYLSEQFADKVRGQLDKLPEAIEKDLTIGFKGFMGVLQGQNGQAANYDNIEKLKDLVARFTNNPTDYKENFEKLANNFQSFWQPLYSYLKEEIKRVHEANKERINPKPSGDEQLYTSKLDAAHTALNNLLDHISNHRYNHEVTAMLDQLTSATATLAPASFARTTTPLLDGIGKGVEGFVSELGRAYISAYDSETFGGEMFEKQKLTPYGAKFAKICLTVVCTLKATLTDLTHNCKSLRGQQINKSTDVGRSFVGHGYAVSDATLQNGELQNKPTVAGENVAKRLILRISGADDNQHLRFCESNKKDKADHFHVFDAIDCIFTHFEQYNELCHLLTASAKQHPCSVYDILIWLSGFPYTAVYSTMRDITISDLFDNPHKKAAGDDELELTSTDMAAQSITAHPRNISYNYVRKAVDHICATSYDVLTAVLGTGDSRAVYASDFCNNSFNFHYPSDPSDCLDMLLDLLRRLLPVFRFLELQCNIKPEHHGWSHCRYGRDIPTTKSQCNEHSSEEPNGQAKCQVNCQATSPLMLYLSDSLPGHLPHQLQSVGCRAKCSTCPKNQPGQPCLIPLGFKGFSGSTKTGRQLRDAINIFIGTGLISSLMCLLPKPPSTLPEHFQFVFTLVGAFSNDKVASPNAVHAAFVKSIKKQSIDLYAEPSELTGALRDAYKNGQSHEVGEHPKASDSNLSTLSTHTTCNYPNKDVHCAPYLSTLHSDAYHYAAEKHAGLYLSWAVYLPWSFWQCLESLFKAFTNISCQDWGCRRCTHGTACKRGKHGAAYHCQCKGLVECRGVISTLYSFGFTFGNPEKLLDAEGRRYCHHFYKQLHNVLNSNYFRKLFEKCDEFIFTIREPFIWLNVALWSLSLFYLICVMVGRLDLLHIRSHLRSPSSHRITAQSLLAAAQVGRLAKISYLQP